MRPLFHVSMIIDANGLYAVTSAATAHKAIDVDIRPVAGNGAAAPGVGISGRTPQTTARTFMLEWMGKNPKFSTGEAVKAAEDAGMSRSSIYTFLNVAVNKEGLVKRTGAGSFVVTAKGKKAGLSPAQERASTSGTKLNGVRRSKPQVNEITHRQFIVRAIKRSNGKVPYRDLRELFRGDGRNPKSVDGALGKLKEDKMITGTGAAGYSLTAKGREA